MNGKMSKWDALFGGVRENGEEAKPVRVGVKKSNAVALPPKDQKRLVTKAAKGELIRRPNDGMVDEYGEFDDWPTVSKQGVPDGRSTMNVTWFCEKFSDPKIQAKFNEFDQRTYVIIDDGRGDIADVRPRELDDAAIREVKHRMHRAGCIVTSGAVEDGLKRMGEQNKFHPVREYLDGLEWDGEKRIGKLIPYYLSAQNTPLNRAMGKAWMVAAVRRVRQPGVKFDPILTLRGEQGSGKSTFFRVLGTPRGHNFFSDSMDIGASAKETIESMSGVWVAEFPELSKLSVREVEQVKRAASVQSDRARVAFARLAAAVPRQFVCGATVNQMFFLRDDTGNRRFWIAEVGMTREAALISDVDQLWAEAAYLEANGEVHNIPNELWAAAEEVAEHHMKEDPVADAVALKLAELPESDAVVLSHDMALAIGIEDVTRRGGHVAQSMAAGVRRAGWSAKLGRVRGLKSSGSVRHYAAPSTGKVPQFYKYSASAAGFFPFVKGKLVVAS